MEEIRKQGAALARALARRPGRKQPKEKPADAVRRWRVAHALAPKLHPDAKAALKGLNVAFDRLALATDFEVAVAMLRNLADTMDSMEAPPRPAHRPKGARQYSETELRNAMEVVKGCLPPTGSGFRSTDRYLAHRLHEKYPGRCGQDADAIYRRIRRIWAEDKAAEKAAREKMRAAGIESPTGLDRFFFGLGPRAEV